MTTFALPIDTQPMEAKSADTLPQGQGLWRYEPKWDGFRCLVFLGGEAVDLRAKSGKPLGRYFPEIVAALGGLSSCRAVIDGELVVGGAEGAAFDALQMRLHPAESRIRKLAVETPARLILFDMLADPEGRSLLDVPFRDRRCALETFVAAAGRKALTLSRGTEDPAEAKAWLEDSGRGGTDGVVAKRLDGGYRPGMRSMVKVKRLRTADCVVGGFRYLASSRQVGSLLLGLYNEAGELDHVGFTSTIADVERGELTRKLEALRAPPGFDGKAPGGPSRWSTARSADWQPLRPELVVEVRFDHVTARRFRHGTKIMRWRPDKAPRQCTFDQLPV